MVYVSGSITEGFGNSGSDLDVFLVTADQKAINEWAAQGGLATALVGYGSSYIDYERRNWDEMQSLSDRLNAIDAADFDAVWRVPYAQLDLYYRTSIGEAKHNPERFQTLVGGFRTSVIHSLLEAWCGLRYAIQRHAVEDALSQGDWRAAYFAGHAALQNGLDAYLAREGEGYTGLKWRFEKIERRFGRESVFYRNAWSLKALGAMAPEQYVRDALAFLDTLDLGRFLTWRLDCLNPKARDDCKVFEIAGRHYLFQNKTRAYHLSPDGAFLWSLLDGTRTRTELTEALAEHHGMATNRAAEKLEDTLRTLRSAGLIAEG